MKSSNSLFVNYVRELKTKFALNKKIVLIQAPQFLFDSFNPQIVRNRGYYAYPPTGLQVLARELLGRGLDVEIIDLNFLVLERVIENSAFDYTNWICLLDEHLEGKDPFIVGVTSINVYSNVFESGYPLTVILEKLRDRGQSIVVAGGAIVANEYENYLKKNLCHFTVQGEGENKIHVLFDRLYNSDYPKEISKGIYFKYNDKVVGTEGGVDIVTPTGNLKSTYGLIPIEAYNKVGSLNPYSRMAGLDKKFSVFQLNRGCRANCRFCGVTEVMGKGVRNFPVADLLEEVTFLVKEKDIRHFDVLDDDFLVNKKEITELLEGLVNLNKEYGITWSSNNGLIAASITEELMSLMSESGCMGFRIGIETANPEMLKKMNKPATLKTLRKAGSIMNRYPTIFSGGNYILGLLGEETFGEMMDTYRFSCELDLDWASFAIFQFTSKANSESEGKTDKTRGASDFVPSKSESSREVTIEQGIVSGPEVLDLPSELIPSSQQLKQIWFTFNLVVNYINNRNLKAGGRTDKFTEWLEAVRLGYPDNPYMSLFAGLGRVLMGESEKGEIHLKSAKSSLSDSEYWKRRFHEFDFMYFINNFPTDRKGVDEGLTSLRSRYLPYS